MEATMTEIPAPPPDYWGSFEPYPAKSSYVFYSDRRDVTAMREAFRRRKWKMKERKAVINGVQGWQCWRMS